MKKVFLSLMMLATMSLAACHANSGENTVELERIDENNDTLEKAMDSGFDFSLEQLVVDFITFLNMPEDTRKSYANTVIQGEIMSDTVRTDLVEMTTRIGETDEENEWILTTEFKWSGSDELFSWSKEHLIGLGFNSNQMSIVYGIEFISNNRDGHVKGAESLWGSGFAFVAEFEKDESILITARIKANYDEVTKISGYGHFIHEANPDSYLCLENHISTFAQIKNNLKVIVLSRV